MANQIYSCLRLLVCSWGNLSPFRNRELDLVQCVRACVRACVRVLAKLIPLEANSNFLMFHTQYPEHAWLRETPAPANLSSGTSNNWLRGAQFFLKALELLIHSRNSPHFMEPETSLPHSQVPISCLYHEPEQWSQYIPFQFIEDPF
jgi:hypothetical protein